MAYASARNRRWPAPTLALIVLVFLGFSLPPYFTGGTRVPATFALHYPLLVGHVMFASVAMVCAVAQIWPGLRRRHPVCTAASAGSTCSPRSRRRYAR